MYKFLSVLVFFCFQLSSTPTYAVEPLSCRMQVLLHMTYATSRDSGRSRRESYDVINSGGDLTQSEIKLILDNIYIKYKDKSPEEIGNIIHRRCK